MSKQKEERQKRGVIKKTFMIIGIVVVVLFLIILLLVGVLAIVKPYDIDVTKVIPTMLDKTPTSSYDHPYLTTQQEAVLESVGIDPEDVPTQITPSQQQCAEDVLGSERVSEIASGSAPSLTDILKARHCFE